VRCEGYQRSECRLRNATESVRAALGLGRDCTAPVARQVSQIWALHEMAKCFKREEGDRMLFAMHAVRILCPPPRCPLDLQRQRQEMPDCYFKR
jgi:hypothetical protein